MQLGTVQDADSFEDPNRNVLGACAFRLCTADFVVDKLAQCISSDEQIQTLNEVGVTQNSRVHLAYLRLLRARVGMAGAFRKRAWATRSKPKPACNGLRSCSRRPLISSKRLRRKKKQRFDLQSDELQQAFAAYRSTLEEQTQALNEGTEARYVEVNLKARAANDRFDQALQGFEQQLDTQIASIMVQAHSRYNLAQVQALILLMIAALLVAGCWWFIASRLLRPLREGREHFDEIASGDLRRSITVQSSNEIGQLFSACRKCRSASARPLSRSVNTPINWPLRRAVETGDGGK
jgi:methyl-accepting chemotaxis protein